MASAGDNRPSGWIIIVGVPLAAAMAGLLCHIACSWREKDDRRRRGLTAAAPGVQERPLEAVLVVEVRPGPLLCMYQSGDERWREAAACPVCLSDLADGETIGVLPACMHYFHPACVGQWLQHHDTCPVCRAGAVPAVAAFPADIPFPAMSAV